MKRKISNFIIIVTLILALFLLTGCTNNDEENIQQNKQVINNIENEETKVLDIVGEWKAIKTDNNTYSLGWLYGTSLTLGNELIFNEDGTYSLGLGVTYWQEGKFEIDGTTIKLTETEYKGDNPDKRIAEELIIDGNQIILEETEENQKINVIFNNINNIENATTSNVSNTENKTTTNSLESTTTGELKIGNKTIKYGTYTGIDAATGEILVIKNDNSATLNGTSYKYEVGNYNFTQDSSSDSYKDGIIFKNSDGSIAFSLYVASDGSLKDDPMGYVYSGN